VSQRILIVDDEAAVLFAVIDYLERYGYEVDGARREVEAQALLGAAAYSLVITDLCLTGGDDTDGFQIIQYVRERSPRTRIILMTGHGSPEVESQAQRLGVDTVLHKPLSLPSLAEVAFALLRPAESGK
jgi:DNA-binding response OmpR family regulator